MKEFKVLFVLACTLCLFSACNKTEWEDEEIIIDYPCGSEDDLLTARYEWMSRSINDNWDIIFKGRIITNHDRGFIKVTVTLYDQHDEVIHIHIRDGYTKDDDMLDDLGVYRFSVPEVLSNRCDWIDVHIERSQMTPDCQPVKDLEGNVVNYSTAFSQIFTL